MSEVRSTLLVLFLFSATLAPHGAVATEEAEEVVEQAVEDTRLASRADQQTEEYFGARRFRVTASTGVDYSTGDFGSPTDTDLLYVPFGLKFEWDPIVLKLTIPYVRIDGDVVPVGGSPEAVPGLSGVRDGLGDIVLAATYVYYPSVSFLPVTELTGKVKFGTGNEDDGLGTGKNDYTIQLDLSKRFGRFTPFGAVGYKFIGSPSGFSLNNKVFVYGGVTGRITDRINAGLVYDWSQSAVSGRTDFHELSPFMTFKFGRYFAIDPYFVVGLSSSSPDWGTGMQLRFIWDRD